MLSIVCWLWAGNRKYRAEHVNVLARMFKRHLSLPHRLVCITDEPGEYECDVIPTPAAAIKAGEINTLENKGFPSCYRRLWMFSKEAEAIGERVMLTDIDLIITGNIDHLFQSSATFVGWRPALRWGNKRVAGGTYILKTGSHTEVWDTFNEESPAIARAAGYRGSDQSWISYHLAERCELFPDDAGICSYNEPRGKAYSKQQQIIQFNGHLKPWACREKWVQQAWR